VCMDTGGRRVAWRFAGCRVCRISSSKKGIVGWATRGVAVCRMPSLLNFEQKKKPVSSAYGLGVCGRLFVALAQFVLDVGEGEAALGEHDEGVVEQVGDFGDDALIALAFGG
jgi:hypothetical protein